MGPEELESILSNLVENARQHGGPRVNVHISAHPKKVAKKDFVEIVIEDDGPGISNADADRIFTPFFTTAKQSGGTGLGPLHCPGPSDRSPRKHCSDGKWLGCAVLRLAAGEF